MIEIKERTSEDKKVVSLSDYKKKKRRVDEHNQRMDAIRDLVILEGIGLARPSNPNRWREFWKTKEGKEWIKNDKENYDRWKNEL